MRHTQQNIAIFLSGSGSNAKRIVKQFKDNDKVSVKTLISNKPENGANEIGKEAMISVFKFSKEELDNKLLEILKELEIHWIVLAGFLLKIPKKLVEAYPNKIINIHPALLPKFGGKGMYGKYVHQAVYDSKELETGVTVHFVNEHYDEGNIIAQFSCNLDDSDTPETIEKKVRELEKKHFAPTIEKLILL